MRIELKHGTNNRKSTSCALDMIMDISKGGHLKNCFVCIPMMVKWSFNILFK